jgi:hypothetical protein
VTDHTRDLPGPFGFAWAFSLHVPLTGYHPESCRNTDQEERVSNGQHAEGRMGRKAVRTTGSERA